MQPGEGRNDDRRKENWKRKGEGVTDDIVDGVVKGYGDTCYGTPSIGMH